MSNLSIRYLLQGTNSSLKNVNNILRQVSDLVTPVIKQSESTPAHKELHTNISEKDCSDRLQKNAVDATDSTAVLPQIKTSVSKLEEHLYTIINSKVIR